MKRLLPVLLVAAAVAALSGCDHKKKEGKDGVADAAARREEPRSRNRTAGGRLLVVDAPLSDAVGAMSNGAAYNQGSAFFDGARPNAGVVDPAVAGRATAVRNDPKRFVWTTDDGRLSTDLNLPPPPLPDGHDYSGAGTTRDTAAAGEALLGFTAFQLAQKFPSAAPIMSRLGWKADKPKSAYSHHDPVKVTVHHTQGQRPMNEADTARIVKAIQYDHMYLREKSGKKDNFIDIGYHFLIAGDGRVVEGRRAEYVGAHAGGANSKNLGIAVMGDFNVIKPNEAQIVSLTRLVTYLSLKYKKDPSQKGFLEPHQHYTQTDCPGKNMMAILEALRQKIDSDHDRIAGGGQAESFLPIALLPGANPDA